VTLIEVKPHHLDWKVFEAVGVEPVSAEKDHAIDYAQAGACFRFSGTAGYGIYSPTANRPFLCPIVISRLDVAYNRVVTKLLLAELTNLRSLEHVNGCRISRGRLRCGLLSNQTSIQRWLAPA
jgi:hypothetical protein